MNNNDYNFQYVEFIEMPQVVKRTKEEISSAARKSANNRKDFLIRDLVKKMIRASDDPYSAAENWLGEHIGELHELL